MGASRFSSCGTIYYYVWLNTYFKFKSAGNIDIDLGKTGPQ